MYLFQVKESRTNTDVIIVRTIFALDATVAFLTFSRYGYLVFMSGLLFALVSYFVQSLNRYISLQILLYIGILILSLLTASPFVLIIILLHWLLIRYLRKNTEVTIDEKNINIKGAFSTKVHVWTDVEFAVLKDGLLTIQFNNKHFFQQEVEWNRALFSAEVFNRFCNEHTEGN